jgi:hypothetical protein
MLNEQIHWLHRRLPRNHRPDAGVKELYTLKANGKAGKFRHPGEIQPPAGWVQNMLTEYVEKTGFLPPRTDFRRNNTEGLLPLAPQSTYCLNEKRC